MKRTAAWAGWALTAAAAFAAGGCDRGGERVAQLEQENAALRQQRDKAVAESQSAGSRLSDLARVGDAVRQQAADAAAKIDALTKEGLSAAAKAGEVTRQLEDARAVAAAKAAELQGALQRALDAEGRLAQLQKAFTDTTAELRAAGDRSAAEAETLKKQVADLTARLDETMKRLQELERLKGLLPASPR